MYNNKITCQMLRRYGLQYLNPDEILPIFWSIFEESKDPYRKIEGALGIGAYHIVEEYLKNGGDPDIIEYKDDTVVSDRCYSTIFTARYNPSVVKLLLEYGANPNINYIGGKPVLERIFAAHKVVDEYVVKYNLLERCLKTAEILIDYGANTDFQIDGYGSRFPISLLEYGVAMDSVDLVKSLIRSGVAINQNKECVLRCQSVEMLEVFKILNVDIFCRDYYGNTLLHSIAKNAKGAWRMYEGKYENWFNLGKYEEWLKGVKKLIKKLKTLKMDINVLNNNGETPLDVCINKDVFDYFIELGADKMAGNPPKDYGDTRYEWYFGD